MNIEDINRRIAELCGWTQIEAGKGLMLGMPCYKGYPPTGAVIGRKQPLPNYFQSLDACREFEKWTEANSNPVQSSMQPNAQYDVTLMQVCNPGYELWDLGHFVGDYWDALKVGRATPQQRCEAFLRLHNQWPV